MRLKRARRLSNDVNVANADEDSSVNGAVSENDVLANLPRARPQRASARRIAARNGAGGSARGDETRSRASKAGSAKRGVSTAAATASDASGKAPARRAVKPVRESAAASAAKSRVGRDKGAPSAASRATGPRATAPDRAAKRAKRAPVEDPAPRQGYECDGETPAGAVQPPAGIELVATAAEIVGELAKSGVATGERLLKDALSRLPL
jgi:hypothetical protein